MYEKSGNKVTLVAHSMGGPVSLYFLNTIVPQHWKEKYLHAYITLSGAWAGSLLTVREAVSGYDLGFNLTLLPEDFVDAFFRNVSRTHESGVWLFPDPDVFKPESIVIVSTPTRNYTAENYTTLFNDMKYPTGASMYNGVKNIRKASPGPKVHTHCYWGLGTKTPLSFHYNKSLPVDAGYDPSNIYYLFGW